MKKVSFKNLFSNRKILYLVLCIMLISVFTLTIAYAALNTVLKITGNAEVVASSWHIHLDNIKVKSGSVGGVAPKITNATTATFSIKLTTPGDFYEFSIDVVNDGTIDAMIDSVTKTPVLTESQAKYLNYIVEYENGNSISARQLVKADSFVRLKVRVEYRKDLQASDLPTSNDSLTLSFTVNYVQADNSGSNVLNNGTLKAMVKSGTGTDVGDEICIGNECFYVISSTENDVTMLAKYNLYVGYKNDPINGVSLLENPTGIQNEMAWGFFPGYSSENPAIATTPFSNTNYWADTAVDYPAYVYNEKSLLYEYVENYKSYLEELGTDVNESRLITFEELVKLGCSKENGNCSAAPEFVYSTSYWTGTANSAQDMWYVFKSTAAFVNSGFSYYLRGIRPVMTISKDQILGIKSNIKPVANGSLDEVGTVVTIGSEQFYTIGTEGDNVKLLAKYNLHVGNKYDDTNGTVALSNSTGIQSEMAIGWFDDYSIEKPIIGIKTFSSTSYWSSTVASYPSYVYNENSNLYEYIQNYKIYLENLGTFIYDARLITMKELESLGCKGSGCHMAPSWVYSTTYWSGEAYSSTCLWYVYYSSYLDYSKFDNDRYGVRPVVVIPKSEF